VYHGKVDIAGKRFVEIEGRRWYVYEADELLSTDLPRVFAHIREERVQFGQQVKKYILVPVTVLDNTRRWEAQPSCSEFCDQETLREEHSEGVSDEDSCGTIDYDEEIFGGGYESEPASGTESAEEPQLKRRCVY